MASACRSLRSGRVVPGTRGSTQVRRNPDSPTPIASPRRPERGGPAAGLPPGPGRRRRRPPGSLRPPADSLRRRRTGNTRFEAGSPASRFRDRDGPIRPGAQRSRRRVAPRGRVRGEGTPRVSCAGRRIRSGGVVPGTRGSRPVRRRPDSAIVTARSARARHRPERPGLRRGCPAVRRQAGAGTARGRPRDRAETGGNAGLRAPAGRFVRGAPFREAPVQGRFAGGPIPRP